MKVKRIFVFCLAVVLALTMTACGSVQKPSDSNGGKKAVSGNEKKQTSSSSDDKRAENDKQGAAEAEDDMEESWGEEDREDSYNLSKLIEGWQPFFQKSFYQTMSDAGTDNRIYSPVNLYLCLAMLSEISEGDTRTQITDLLGQDEQKDIRRLSGMLYRSLYHRGKEEDSKQGDDGEAEEGYLASREYENKCILGNSLWLNEKIPFQKKILSQLQESYYAQIDQGEMGTEEMDRKIQKWLNKVTGGKLKEQAGKIHTKEENALLMFSSINFEASWQYPFLEEKTKEGVFHATASKFETTTLPGEGGSDITCNYLYGSFNAPVVKTKEYMATELQLQNNAVMHIILPEKGITVEDVLEREKGKDLIELCTGGTDPDYAIVDFSMPKFHIGSSFELNGILEKLGVTDMFLVQKANFLPLTRGTEESPSYDLDYNIYVDRAEQTSDMAVDENGCSVASYTMVEMTSGAAMPEKHYKMHCDRPFLFIITGNTFPLFTGVVQNVYS